MKDAAGRDIARDLYEGQLPAQNLDAAAVGGARGSRAGAQEAVLKRGAADRLSDISSQIDMGIMDRASSNWARQMGGLQSGASGLAGLGGMAPGMYGSGFNLGKAGLAQQYGAGAGFQADQQAQLDAAQQRHREYQTGGWGPLKQYADIVGGGGYGSQQTSSTPGPSGLQQGLGSAMALYSLFK
jgi:hypothetical protein